MTTAPTRTNKMPKSTKKVAKKKTSAKTTSGKTAKKPKPIGKTKSATAKTAVKKKKAVKKTQAKQWSYSTSTKPEKIAEFIAHVIKSENAAPGMRLPIPILRTLLRPAPDEKIMTALYMLTDRGVLLSQPDESGAPEFVVAGASQPTG